MTTTLAAVRHFANHAPERCAVRSRTRALTYRGLLERATAVAGALEAREIEVAAIAADNGPEWIAVDLAAQLSGTVLVPLPPYFTREQIVHALADSGADALLAAPRLLALRDLDVSTLEPFAALGGELAWCRLRANPAAEMPAGTAKISYTSGTTDKPKGVCLRQSSMDIVAESLRGAVAELEVRTHLCVLPLATLLENVAGVYAPLQNGAEIIVPNALETGLSGAARFDAATLLRCLDAYRPESIILVPELLAALVAALELGTARPQGIKLVAVGGGRVSPALLERADRLGLPVYEGYGLTECASVVTLNTPAARRIGSVGRPLPHVELTLDAHGEIHVGGPAVSGYVGGDHVPQRFATGDLGQLDGDGFLHVSGRRKNLFITSFGRNVSPEWVESELTEEAPIAQAAVFGEARPWNVALIVAVADADLAAIQAAIDAANHRLPDYARVGDWFLADEPFTPANGLLTANGRNRRAAVWRRYRWQLDALYDRRLDLTA
ncbi:MAG TPA: AMP-binding protein [Gammaproteobacteria bacterium]|nr:AMP-binding protein [Gammaproteobacteria bacterium]